MYRKYTSVQTVGVLIYQSDQIYNVDIVSVDYCNFYLTKYLTYRAPSSANISTVF